MSAESLKLINNIKSFIINPIIGFMFAVAVAMFLYGIVEYIYGADNEEKREVGKRHIIYGIIGIFVMVGVFGIMNLISGFWFEIGTGY